VLEPQEPRGLPWRGSRLEGVFRLPVTTRRGVQELYFGTTLIGSEASRMPRKSSSTVIVGVTGPLRDEAVAVAEQTRLSSDSQVNKGSPLQGAGDP
jgi:hypothetical protein